MNWRISLLGRSLIPTVRLHMLDKLARATAEGFETSPPVWARRNFAARLTEYAEFTAHRAGLLVAAGDGAAVEAARDRLRSGATELGASLRATLGVRSSEDAFDALRLLYGQIGIELAGGALAARESTAAFEVTVDRCFFADYYSDSVCRVIEGLDQGLVAGLFDGGSLEFSERLTEGRPRCRACLRLAQERS